MGTRIWELGPFRDIVSNRDKFEQLEQQGYVLSENLPLETRDGSKIAVDFISNVYQAGDRNVIQCNVRNISERFEHRLFLSATPHNGHSNSFSALLEMLDPQRFTRGVEVRHRGGFAATRGARVGRPPDS